MCDYFSAVAGDTKQAPLANLLVINIKFALYLLEDYKGVCDSKIETTSESTSDSNSELNQIQGF